MRALAPLFAALWALGACTTTQGPRTHYPDPDVENPGVIVIAQPVLTPEPAPPPPAPPAAPSEPPEEPLVEAPDRFADLDGWAEADLAPALAAFRRSCASFLLADPAAALNPNLPQYGTYGDWRSACEALRPDTKARAFFEAHFAPVALSTPGARDGLLTGYYEPEVEVRLTPDRTFSEPVLALPTDPAHRVLPRAAQGPHRARVIAYGRPIDVFFLQIQGSGRLRYADGRTLRAAYAGNNGHPYRSIGRVLIARGELSPNQSAKRDIERWMAEAGRQASRELMNENPRYIFFTEQAIRPGEGPNGAMRVPLTAMGAAAVDPRYHPYGTLAFLQTRLPQRARDYRGQPAGVLVALQDTGSAIRGPLRGDLFFGSGPAAGARAGVMKHPVRWTLLLPRARVAADAPQS